MNLIKFVPQKVFSPPIVLMYGFFPRNLVPLHELSQTFRKLIQKLVALFKGKKKEIKQLQKSPIEHPMTFQHDILFES